MLPCSCESSVQNEVVLEELLTADDFEKEWNKHDNTIQELLITIQKQLSDAKDPEKVNLKCSIRPLTDQLDAIDKKIYKKITEKLQAPHETICGFSREKVIKYACHGFAALSAVGGALQSAVDNATNEESCKTNNWWAVGFILGGVFIEMGYNLLGSLEGSEEKERQKLKNIRIQAEKLTREIELFLYAIKSEHNLVISSDSSSGENSPIEPGSNSEQLIELYAIIRRMDSCQQPLHAHGDRSNSSSRSWRDSPPSSRHELEEHKEQEPVVIFDMDKLQAKVENPVEEVSLAEVAVIKVS